ncbi:MAG: DUF2808 domain-containing protein [Pegethrix bostrychoides GSE-TBD4-15B]|jgi:hypothetical protein|uniref:DUF2808 domain-containing protein n=1 Tax=Pegethrix bostrychoides GSE-TBD4-15B TaxID=2839662 RepID=A0A951U2W9_9CYAN|nr:DUF2808 domain-containing protein [Pegethrix bostrychoides GSE-TBD4-15B]
MLKLHRKLVGLSLGWIVLTLSPLSAQSAKPKDRGYFVRPPSLEATRVTQAQVFAQGATYYFTLSLPNHDNTPLQQISIAQQDAANRARFIQFDPTQAEVFVGTPDQKGELIPVREAQFDPDKQTLLLTLDSPVQPGDTVTVALHPKRNPRRDGLYLFGITAFPTGTTPQGQFLGFGRIQFYGDENAAFESD